MEEKNNIFFGQQTTTSIKYSNNYPLQELPFTQYLLYSTSHIYKN